MANYSKKPVSQKSKSRITSSRYSPFSRWRSSLRMVNFMLLFALVGIVFLYFTNAYSIAGMYGSAEQDQVNRINSRRSSLGRPGLQHIECLNSIAEQHAIEMKNAGGIYHTSQSAFTSRVDNACKGRWSILGENVGVGGDSASIFNAFMASTAHKNNIEDSRFTKVGIGAYWDGSRLWITQVFANCSSCTTEWKRNATLPADPTPPITVSGRVYNLATASGYGSIGIETCTGKTVTTGSDGRFSFTVSQYATFCVRTKSSPSGVTGPYLRPEVTGYRSCPTYGANGTTGYCASEGKTYEAQVAGAACYNNTNCGTGKIGGSDTVKAYDRSSDAGYVFVFTGSTSGSGTTTSCSKQINFNTIAASPTTYDGPVFQTTSTSTEDRYYYYKYSNPSFYNHQISSVSPTGGSYTHSDVSGAHGIMYNYQTYFNQSSATTLTPSVNYSYIYTYQGQLWVKRVNKSTGAVTYQQSSGDGTGPVTDTITTTERKNTSGSTVYGPTLNRSCQ